MTVAAGTVALNISYEGLSLMVFLIMMKKQLRLRKNPSRDWSTKTMLYLKRKMAKIYNLSITKTAGNPYPFGPHVTISSIQ